MLAVFVPGFGDPQFDASPFLLHEGGQGIQAGVESRGHHAVGAGSFFILEDDRRVGVRHEGGELGIGAMNPLREWTDGGDFRLIRDLVAGDEIA